ncbi:MAG TPA: ABC transporter permease [Thermoplasmata archaeon]|nr:ABC transporter permease [Thermoplasmata archaeon]
MGLARHLAKRAVFLVLTLILAIYITVVIANGGGLIDNILKSQIAIELRQQLQNDPGFRRLPPEEQDALYNRTYNQRVEARGLNEPFVEKSFRFTIDALTLQLGRSQTITSTGGSHSVADIIGERLPRTLTLFTVANAVAAVFGIWLGLWMARRALTVFDRGMTVLSVTTFIVPPWVYGIFFILIFGFELHWFPTSGWIGVPAPNQGTFAWYLDVLYHMLLPMITFAFASFGSWSYTTRNLVLQIMDEDFVTAARAKGLPERTVLSKYVLRAASPPIVTSLALTLISAWQGAIITETVFNYEGIGQLFFAAIGVFDAPLVIALTALYAYLLVVTVFILDLVYGLLDPRIRALRR